MSRQSEDRRGGGYSSMKDLLAKEQVGAAASYLELPKDTPLFKLKPGIMYIDIIPFIAGKGNPNASEGMRHWERTFWVHNSIGVDNSKVICAAKTFGEKCPICEFREANSSKAARDEDVYEQIKALEPKKRQLFNVIDTKSANKDIQIWNESYHLFGKDLYSEVRNADERDHWDEFYYLEKGWTLKIGVEERSYNRRSFSAVDTIHFRERDKDYPDEMAEDAPCLDDCLIVPNYDDLKKLFLQSGPAAGGEREERGRGRGDREERGGSRREERDEKEEPRGRKRNEDREERGGRDRDRGEGREERSERRGRRDEKDEAPPAREERSERRSSRRDEPDEPDRSDRRRSRDERDEPRDRDKDKDKDDKGKDDPWANRKGGKDKEDKDPPREERGRDRDRRDDPDDRPRVRSDEDSESRRERGSRRDEPDEPRGRDRDDDRGRDRDRGGDDREDRNRNPKDWGEFEGRRKR
jgi:hypothetical protein